jgi:putative ABC transport system permease protein
LNAGFQAAVAGVDHSLPVFNIHTIDWYVSSQLEGYRQFVLLLGVFGGIALLLAIVGIYGIMAHSVTQRTSEIGIRVALGARSGQVLRLIIGRGVVLVAIGLVLGSAASLALTRVIRSFLYGVTATDPVTFALVLTGLAAIAALACYIPSRRALKIDPIVALRYE